MVNIEKTDEELVALSLQNRDFFAYIVDRYEEKMFRYVRRITNLREEDLSDILQDIFIKVYQNLNDYDRNLSFSSWIYRIAHNQVVDTYRKNKSRPQGNYIDVDDSVIENFANDFDFVKAIDNKYLKENIKNILDHLDENYKEILILKFFEEKDYKEISDILKKPMGTVATLINRAKKQFKEELEKSKINL
ncbi:hypothetical protein A3E89_02415 [Candidatus Campbellbacteria bacterium RIFCSPHIGHO2_12_FULL_35_10]|uniref:RNA polymerase sigma-70 region 2 domain-containing protein n=1 Tax=Candidatus Campbellbacteria bacterium RIFCSPHIGHO2_12_FULL_35_10 TaxID=1797578 RepID=A0A1F5EQK5_9BACT|nr:MAG: hypothetical protein A3E89_02415 [Candidatus Campbellbacteria bacterium RIFCSPHIGHO2_12_FULL_35_10]